MEQIKSFYFRIVNAFKIAYWAFMNPATLKPSNFRMLSDLLNLILKVGTENRHMMSHIAYVHPEEGEKQIVSIWAGAGLEADPLKRIAELYKENERLKKLLSEQVQKNVKP